MLSGLFKRAVSVFGGRSSDPPEADPPPALPRGKRPNRGALRARFEEEEHDDGHEEEEEPGPVTITPSRRKRVVSVSSTQTPNAKRARVAAKSAAQPPRPAKQPSARRAKRPSLPSPPSSSPRVTRSTAARVPRSRKSQAAASPSSDSDSSDDDYTAQPRLPLAVKTPTKAASRPVFVNDDEEAGVTEHDTAHDDLRVENLERTLFRAKPHLIQETFAGNTWLVVLASSMLDAHPDHQRMDVTAVFCTLSTRWPTPEAVLAAPAPEITKLLGPFASYLHQLQTLAAVFVRCPITPSKWRAESCWAPPYTPYVKDVYRTFCVRGDEWKKVRPKPESDLAQYLQWRWARTGTMWDAQYGAVGQIKTSQVRNIIVKCWAPSFHALPYSLAHYESTPVCVAQLSQ